MLNSLAPRKTAILVDGGFYIKRYRALYSTNSGTPSPELTPYKMVKNFRDICLKHLSPKEPGEQPRELYRIFYYDCPPLEIRVINPVSKQTIDFSQTREYRFRKEFLSELKKQRKVALRYGRLAENGVWQIKPHRLRELLDEEITAKDLEESDVFFSTHQKGIDLKIGLDVASLAHKRLVDQIILIAGDCDFIPAAKLARQEGIDFIVDPMWNPINEELYEHIDGLRSTCAPPVKRETGVGVSMPGQAAGVASLMTNLLEEDEFSGNR